MATATAPKPRTIKPKVADQKMLIGGKWVESASGKTFETLDPATGEVICRVAGKLRRSAGRRKQREEHAAGPEADRPVPDSRWDSLLAAVHEEIQQLPDVLRTAFVLCDLEGVRQPDAAARLGWKPGTLTGRLCKARQELLDRLTRRGILPAAVAGAVGLGAAAGTAAVPYANAGVAAHSAGDRCATTANLASGVAVSVSCPVCCDQTNGSIPIAKFTSLLKTFA